MKTHSELVKALKLWVHKNNKAFLDFTLDEISDSYVRSLLIDDDRLDIQDKYIENQSGILVSFKGTVEIDYRAAVRRKENKFVYFKLCEAVYDGDGDIIEYKTIGYDW